MNGLTRKVPLRPGTKRMKRRYRAIGNANAAQKAYHDAQTAAGCAFCLLVKCRQPNRTELHHRTTGDLHGQKQLGQGCTVGLCAYHHRGELRHDTPSVDAMRAKYGPNLKDHKRDFLNVIEDNLGERGTGALQRWADQFLPADVVEGLR